MKYLWISAISLIMLGAGCRHITTLTPVKNPDQRVVDYLERNIVQPNFSGKVFCDYAKLGTKTYIRHQYVWILCQEYYRQDKTFSAGTGVALPVDIYTDNDGNVIGHDAPTDEDFDTGQAYKMFPEEVAGILKNGGPTMADDRIISRAKEYFNSNHNQNSQ